MTQIAFPVFTVGDTCGASPTARLDSLDGIAMRGPGGAELYETGLYATSRNAPVAGNLYRWDRSSLAVADCVNVVIPFGQSVLTPGRWLLVMTGGIGPSINALVPIATGLTRIAGFVTTQAAGDVELGPGLAQTFAALAGDVFLADIEARAVGTSGTPATGVRYRAKMDGLIQVVANGIDSDVGPPDGENAGVNGLLVAPAAGNRVIQAFVEVINPPATPTAEVTVGEVNLRVVQLRPVSLVGVGVAPIVPMSASRLLSAEPQVIGTGLTAALTWAGGEINVVTSVPNEAVLVTMSINRANANPPGAGGNYRVRLDGASVGLTPNDDGDWASIFSFTQRIVIPGAGVHTIGVNVTCSAGFGDSESVFQSTLVVVGNNVS